MNKLLIPLVILLSGTGCDLSLDPDLGDGYFLHTVDYDNNYIYKFKKGEYVTYEFNGDSAAVTSEKIYVAPTVIDFDFNNKYIVGLRLNVLPVVCRRLDNIDRPDVRVQNERRYFIVNKEIEKVWLFKDQLKFTNYLKQFEIYDSVWLNLSKFDEAWGNFESRYKAWDNLKSNPKCTPSGAQYPWRLEKYEFAEEVLID